MEYFRRAFSLDHRSVRLFRIALGFALIVYAISFARDIPRFLTEDGMFPVVLLEDDLRDVEWLKDFYRWGPAPWIMLGSVALSGAFMMLNRFPRAFSAFAWVMLILLFNRGPQVMYGADNLIRTICLWAIFLPAGPARAGENRFTNFASFVALGQLALLYFFTGFLKTGDDWQVTGQSVYNTFRADLYARPLGTWLGENLPVGLMSAMTFGVLWWERIGLLLILSPFYTQWTRGLALLGFGLMHLSFAYSLYIGLFPIIDVAFLMLLVPTEFWDYLRRFRVLNEFPRLAPVQDGPTWRKVAPPLAILIFALVLWGNARSLMRDLPGAEVRPFMRFVYRFSLLQSWGMFAPNSFVEDAWWVIEGRTQSGLPVDLLSMRTQWVDFRKPKSVPDRYPSERYIGYLLGNSWHEWRMLHRIRMTRYFCEQWDGRNSDRLAEVKVWQIREPTLAPGRGRYVTSRLVIARECLPVEKSRL